MLNLAAIPDCFVSSLKLLSVGVLSNEQDPRLTFEFQIAAPLQVHVCLLVSQCKVWSPKGPSVSWAINTALTTSGSQGGSAVGGIETVVQRVYMQYFEEMR